MVDESFDPTLQDDLAAAQEAWGAGFTHKRDDQPAGQFQAEITSAIFGRSQNSNRLQIAYELTIIGGEHAGTVVKKYDGLETPQQASITQGQLKQLGVDVKTLTLDKLPALLLSLLGKRITMKCKHNGDFYNVFFLKPIVSTGVTGGTAPAGGTTVANAPAAKGATKRKSGF